MFAFLSAPIDTVPPSLGSLAKNELCGVTFLGSGTYTTEGITKLCEALKGSAVTSLKCAAAPRVLVSVSAPIDTPHHQPHSSARSLRSNSLGPKGAAALAEGLKGNSKLQSLEWAAWRSNQSVCSVSAR